MHHDRKMKMLLCVGVVHIEQTHAMLLVCGDVEKIFLAVVELLSSKSFSTATRDF